MNPELILVLVQLGKFAMESIEALNSGQKTEAEIANEWTKLRNEIDEANRLREEAGD